MMIPILIRFCPRQRKWTDVSHSYRLYILTISIFGYFIFITVVYFI